jgi:hypothetical protein
MSGTESKDAQAGPKACESIAAIMISHFTTRLEVEAARCGGTLSAEQIRELADSYLSQESRRFQTTYRRSYDACGAARDAKQWESARGRPFDRLLMKSFADLFPARQGDDGGKGLLSRRVIPGFSLAVDKMIGPMLYEQCQRKSQALLDRHKNSQGYDWDRIHRDPETHALINDVLVVAAHYFSNFERRRDWFLAVVNSNLGRPAPNAPDAHWQLTEHAFAELMRALFADLRNALAADADKLRKRYGEHTVDTVQTFFQRLDRE